MDDTELHNLCSALDTLLNPAVDNYMRAEALKLCESYKENDKCTEIGFSLANMEKLSPNIRYFGFQLVKHRVRMCWTTMQSQEQLAIKSHVLYSISVCSDTEPAYIKTLIASILTEIIKHVWPHQWPNMQSEVVSDCCRSLTSTEIIISTFLGLAEDIALYQNIATKSRARGLRQALSIVSPEIISFLLSTLKEQSVLLNNSDPKPHAHLAEVTLQAIAGYIEWVNIDHVFIQDGLLFDTVFQLFQYEHLQNFAAECLYVAVSRKGPPEERKMLLKLTSDYYVEKYVSAIKQASQENGFNEDKFHFLRTTGKIIATLSNLLVGLWEDGEKNTDGCPNELQTRTNFLEVLFFLTSHESRVISQTVLHSWSNLLRHRQIRKDPTLIKLIPLLLELVSKNIAKDFSRDTTFSMYEELEFNGRDEMTTFMKAYRGNAVELLRYCTCALPLEAIRVCFESVQTQLSVKHDSKQSFHLEWEGKQTLLETVLGSVISASEECDEKQRLPVVQAENLMNLFLTQPTEDAIILKIFLSCACSLCKLVALSIDPRAHFQHLFNRIFSILDETTNKTSDPTISALRRHACAVVVRVCKNFSGLLLSVMDHFRSLVLDRLSKTPCTLSPFEKVSMLESLILISNEWNDFSAQSQLIGDVMSTKNQIEQSPAFVSALQSPLAFANAIGLQILPPDLVQDEQLPSAKLRSDIYYYIALTLSVLNRTQIPEENQKLGVENPCRSHVGNAIDHTLTLTQMISAMWSPEIRNVVHPQNLKALDLKESEKRSLIFNNPEQVLDKSRSSPRQNWQRLQNFLILCLDNCYQILGLTGKTLGQTFYTVPCLQSVIVRKALCNVEFLPPIRLKSLIRHFLGNFLKHCPVQLVNEIISPILLTYCQFMMDRIQPAWEAYGKKEAERLHGSNADEMLSQNDDKEETEIVQEQLLRLITREHFDLLVNICVNKKPPSNSKLAVENGIGNDEDTVEMRSPDGSPVVQLTSLGAAVVMSAACEKILCNALIAMSWHDTTTCFKSTQLLCPILKLLLQEKSGIFDENISRFILQSILRGLSRHGQQDGCEAQLAALALMFIRALNHKHTATFASVIHSAVPNADRSRIENYLLKCDDLPEKKRKATFKQLISGAIEQHVGQQFREIPKMNVFQPLCIRRNKAIKSGILNEETSLGLADLFQPKE